MATHSSILNWRIPWTEEPGRLQSTGSHSIGYDGSDLARTYMHKTFVFTSIHIHTTVKSVFQILATLLIFCLLGLSISERYELKCSSGILDTNFII